QRRRQATPLLPPGMSMLQPGTCLFAQPPADDRELSAAGQHLRIYLSLITSGSVDHAPAATAGFFNSLLSWHNDVVPGFSTAGTDVVAVDGLQIGVCVEPFFPELAPDARMLEASERCQRTEHVPFVDPHPASIELPGNAH